MSEWLGLAIWLIAASLTFAAGTVLLVAAGLALAIEEDRCGTGRRCGGGRRSRCGKGCKTSPAVDGPAAGDLKELARAGWLDVDMIRRWEGE
jgi:hypothetical protein